MFQIYFQVYAEDIIEKPKQIHSVDDRIYKRLTNKPNLGPIFLVFYCILTLRGYLKQSLISFSTLIFR